MNSKPGFVCVVTGNDGKAVTTIDRRRRTIIYLTLSDQNTGLPLKNLVCNIKVADDASRSLYFVTSSGYSVAEQIAPICDQQGMVRAVLGCENDCHKDDHVTIDVQPEQLPGQPDPQPSYKWMRIMFRIVDTIEDEDVSDPPSEPIEVGRSEPRSLADLDNSGIISAEAPTVIVIKPKATEVVVEEVQDNTENVKTPSTINWRPIIFALLLLMKAELVAEQIKAADVSVTPQQPVVQTPLLQPQAVYTPTPLRNRSFYRVTGPPTEHR